MPWQSGSRAVVANWLEALARPTGIAARSIAWAPLRAADCDAVLEALARRPSVVGVRETVRWWSLVKIVTTIPGDKAFRPLAGAKCPLATPCLLKR